MQQLQDIARVVDIPAGIFLRELVIVGCLDQPRRPSVKAVGRRKLFLLRLIILIAVNEKVWKAVSPQDTLPADSGCIVPHCAQQVSLQPFDFSANPLLVVAVAVKIQLL